MKELLVLFGLLLVLLILISTFGGAVTVTPAPMSVKPIAQSPALPKPAEAFATVAMPNYAQDESAAANESAPAAVQEKEVYSQEAPESQDSSSESYIQGNDQEGYVQGEDDQEGYVQGEDDQEGYIQGEDDQEGYVQGEAHEGSGDIEPFDGPAWAPSYQAVSA
jgi:hypothetical protein